MPSLISDAFLSVHFRMLRCSPHTTGRWQLRCGILRDERTLHPGRVGSLISGFTASFVLAFLFWFSFRLVALAHTLLCNKKDACAYYQNAAYHVKDCGTDATGGRKLCTCLILNNLG